MQPVKQYTLAKLLQVRCPNCDFHARWNLHAGRVVEVTRLYRNDAGALFASFNPPWKPDEEWIAAVSMMEAVSGFDPEPSWAAVERATGWAPPLPKPTNLQTIIFWAAHKLAPWVVLL
jgi:hypothetical protein